MKIDLTPRVSLCVNQMKKFSINSPDQKKKKTTNKNNSLYEFAKVLLKVGVKNGGSISTFGYFQNDSFNHAKGTNSSLK